MLKLTSICKEYKVGNNLFPALKNISINFRENEFVSILGPSGSGKTTLLNILGGLDHYTSGKIEIDGIDTSSFSEDKWDSYRNHKVGFIFQSYNLIPHETILENVKLALTISGVDKKSQDKLALDALDNVGLKDMAKKKPSELSGGQCQRVAIARALVNKPSILLADEPTGALDSKTSIQIMDLIKEISKDKLVIMVTHNPELANTYSTRIIHLTDGEITSDSNPFNGVEEKKETNLPKSKLSFFTAWKLSRSALKSKKKRTRLVCITASIGLIGVGCVMSLGYGVKNYISYSQSQTISTNPIMISKNDLDLNAILERSSYTDKRHALSDATSDSKVNVNNAIASLVSSADSMSLTTIENEITPEFISYLKNMNKNDYDAIAYSYGEILTPNIYTSYENDDKVYSLTYINDKLIDMVSNSDYKNYVNVFDRDSSIMSQIPTKEYVYSQYNVDGKFPEAKDELLLIVDDYGGVDDLLLSKLGMLKEDEFISRVKNSSETDPNKVSKTQLNYDDIKNKEFYIYNHDDVYSKINDDSNDNYDYKYYQNKNNNVLKISGIAKKKDGLSSSTLSSGLYYTEDLVLDFMNNNKNSNIISNLGEDNEIQSTITRNKTVVGVRYSYSYTSKFTNEEINKTAIVGEKVNSFSSLIQTNETRTLTRTSLGANLDTNNNPLPISISIYPKSLSNLNPIKNYIYNWSSSEKIIIDGKEIDKSLRKEITPTDTLSLFSTLVNSIVTVITNALVAFTGLSLIVSTAMIAIITYVSVVERTKEIGTIRAIGGSKGDIRKLFLAENIIIGLRAGIIGIIVILIFSIVASLILGLLAGTLSFTFALIPWYVDLIILLLSIGLTIIAGLIPANKAAKEDPAVALRGE